MGGRCCGRPDKLPVILLVDANVLLRILGWS
jgi:hypothetical protein